MSKVKVIFEDNHLLVVEKPVNIPSQADATEDMDMLGILKEYIKEKYQKPGNVYLGLIHRLDRPVGGVMVFAKTSKAAARLSEQVRGRDFGKIYLALVHGAFNKKNGSLRNFLYKDTKTNMVKVVGPSHKDAKEALLDYEVIEERSNLTLVRVELHTGRSHQIRVQFAEIGHPLYGDQRYGADVNKVGQQIALWSHEISIEHPVTKERMTFKSNPSWIG